MENNIETKESNEPGSTESGQSVSEAKPVRKRRTNHGARRTRSGVKKPRKKPAAETQQQGVQTSGAAPGASTETVESATPLIPQPHWAVSIPKEEMAALPAAPFSGRITLVDRPELVEAAVEELRNADMIGFDTETKPSFKRGQSFNVALLQLSAGNHCFLIRLNMIGLPDPIRDILEDPGLLKIGLSTHDDFRNLHRLFRLEPGGFVELQDYVKQFQIADNSLTRIHSILFGQRISKGQRLTNWEAPELTRNQQEYAALDAIACTAIYRRLSSGEFTPEESPYWRDINAPLIPTEEISQS